MQKQFRAGQPARHPRVKRGCRHLAILVLHTATKVLHREGDLLVALSLLKGREMNTRRCSMCNIIKGASDFSAHNKSPDGLSYWCKSCRAAYYRERRRKADPALRERLRMADKRASFKHRNKDPFQVMVDAARTRAKCARVPFSITANDLLRLWELCGGVCPVSGITMSLEIAQGHGNRKQNKASLDRIVPGYGYVPENVRLVCWAVNAMKQEWTDGELLHWCKAIAQRLGNNHTR